MKMVICSLFYITVADIDLDSLNTAVICTDAFYNKMILQFSNITDIKQNRFK